MKSKFLYFSILVLSLYSCNSTEQFDEDITTEGLVTVNITNSPLVIGGDDLHKSTRGSVEDIDRTYKFFFEHNDSLGIFPNGGYQIPFVSPLAAGEKMESISIEAKGWNTKAGEKYVAYYPFVYEFRNPSEIPFSYLGQKQYSVTDLSNLAKYSFRFSTQQESTTGVFNFELKDLGATLAIRLAAPAGTASTTWNKAVLETGINDAFAITGTVNLFSTTVENGEVNPINQSSSISIILDEFKAGSDGYIWLYFKIPEAEIPVGHDLKCWLFDTEGNAYTYTRATTSKITFVRGTVYKYAFNLDSNNPIETGTNTAASDLDQALNTMDTESTPVKTITIGDNSPKVDAINIPSGVSQSGSSEVNITFQNPVTTTAANTSNTIVVTDNSAANAPVQTESLSDVNLKFAENTGASEVPSLDINLPSSTVTLAPTSGVTHFNVVTTKTARNTLVIKSGVDINKLYVAGGNVVIEAGAHVGEIINSVGASSTITDWNNGGSTEGSVTATVEGYTSGN